MYIKFFGLLFIVLLTGCAAATSKINQVQQNFIKSFREPGEKRVSSPEETFGIYKCGEKKLYLEHIEVIPETISNGMEINQRLRYALCVPGLSKNLKGKITREIFYKNKREFIDVTEYYFKPGIWNVDVFIEIPPNAEDGEYIMKVALKYGSESIIKKKNFFVKSRSKK